MKYLIIILFISGCSTVSEYNKGCRDALETSPTTQRQMENSDLGVISYDWTLGDMNRGEKI